MNIPERATKEQTEAITQTEGNIRVASVREKHLYLHIE